MWNDSPRAAEARAELARLQDELPFRLEQHGLPDVDPENLAYVQAGIADLKGEIEWFSAHA
jgi:hypothetical protein